MRCWYPVLSYPTQLFQPSFDQSQFSGWPKRITTFSHEVLSDEMHDWANRIGVNLSHIMTFDRRMPGSIPPHIDILSKDLTDVVCAGINFEVRGDSVMQFWDDSETSKKIGITEANSLFVKYEDDSKLNLIDECPFIHKVNLVRTDIPHSVITTSIPRLSVSVRFRDDDGRFPSWERSVEILSSVLDFS